jgi:4-alpha-glucanotransferase
MTGSDLQTLEALARFQGIQLTYHDAAGHERRAEAETLLGLLKTLRVPAQSASERRAALRQARQAALERGVEPVLVAWEGRSVSIRLFAPAKSARRPLACRLVSESKLESAWALGATESPARPVPSQRGAWVTRQIRLPRMPIGYHRLEVELAGSHFRTLIISAPTKSYSPSEATKEWGLFVPVYALHSVRSWGAGNWSDWQRLGERVRSLGGHLLASLPLLSSCLDSPGCEPGPYAPFSRLFWNEFYLDIPQIPEFAACRTAQRLVSSSGFQSQLRQFRRAEQIDYAEQMGLRRRVLESLAQFFFSTRSMRRHDFEAYLGANRRLTEYAQFRAACDQAQCSWRFWPERSRQGELQSSDYALSRVQYHEYVQWLAACQLRELAGPSTGGLKWYFDFPLGVHSDGYDVWRERDLFVSGASVGAPPDPFFSKGQNWGFAPLHPGRLRERQYGYWLECVRLQMRHAQWLRMDHVMGLHRLYWVPEGFPAHAGAYVSYPANEFYAMLCLESHRHRTVLVGENLGTVPPVVNKSMRRHGLRQMYVLQFSQRPSSQTALSVPPERCVASLNTHDTPTFAGHWKGLDLVDHARLGLVSPLELIRQRRNRKRLNEALVRFLRRQGYLPRTCSAPSGSKRLPSARAMLRACLEWLAAGPSEMLLITLEDLWLEERPQNVPGTSTERPNWRRKAARSLESIEQDHAIASLLRDLAWRRQEGHPPSK